MVKNFDQKLIGYCDFQKAIDLDELREMYKENGQNKCYILLLLKAHSKVSIDFQDFDILKDTLFFLDSNHHFNMHSPSKGSLLFFNAEFYCIAFHDKEIACDGILFNHVLDLPTVGLTPENLEIVKKLFSQVNSEITHSDLWTEEMLRTKLKELIITTSRMWLSLHPSKINLWTNMDSTVQEFVHLVDQNFHKIHQVNSYADLLGVSAKTLNRKVLQQKGITPGSIIKQRIVLQAKRYLANTDLSIKQIALELGYVDQSYFVRFFKTQTTYTPLEFRNQNQSLF